MASTENAYEALIRPIEERMIQTVWRIARNADDADEAFQNAVATIWMKRQAIQGHPNPQALVLRMCVNAAYDVLRQRCRRNHRLALSPLPAHLADPAPSPEQRASRREQAAQIQRAIARLPRRQAEAVLMHAVHGLPYRDIAAALGCDESTARTHAMRGRAALCVLLPNLASNNL